MSVGLTIEQLNLSPVAKAAAIHLQMAHPAVIFTSGRRDRWSQACAMATNVAQCRGWIARTYVHAAALQTWVDRHPEAVTPEQLSVGLYRVLLSLDDTDLLKVSSHLSGDAFDLMPLLGLDLTPTDEGQAVIDAIRALPGLETFLTKEGGLHRWHAQFVRSVEASS